MRNLFILTICLFITASSVKAQHCFKVKNPSAFDRQEVIAIPWQGLIGQLPTNDTALLCVIDRRTNQQVDFQFEKQGTTAIQNLLILVDVPKMQEREYCIVKSKPRTISSKTYGRYVPERLDDFAWENDHIAFRVYGKALDGRKDNGWGTDIWAKRVNYPIINSWYRAGNDYHTDHGEGLDYYKVGFTLGAGDIAPFEQDQIKYQGNYQEWTILDNGPIRTSFRLTYKPLKLANKTLTFTKTITIDAGSQLNKIEIDYNWSTLEALDLVIGIVKRKELGTILLDESKGIMAYWEPQQGKNGTIGVACLVKESSGMQVTQGHLLTSLRLDRPGKVTYYNGAAWDKAGRIQSAQAWFQYLDEQVGKEPLIIMNSEF